METKEIRLLTADEIDVRVAQTTNYNGVVKVNLLLYKDARVDMKILDEVFGPMNWKRSHQLIGDRLYCTIEVWDAEKKEWIAKQDVGTESNTEPEKGQASDAFKRAGFNIGIGRELYTAPKIVVTLNQQEYKDNGGRVQVWATFRVKEIGYDAARNINRLIVIGRDGRTRFEMGTPAVNRSRKPVAKKLTDEQYWTIIRNYANGQATKTGGDYRTAWIENYAPDAEAIEKFDHDVENVRLANTPR